jgi:hypothetical protein
MGIKGSERLHECTVPARELSTRMRAYLKIIQTRRMPWRASLQNHENMGCDCRDVRQHIRVTIHSEMALQRETCYHQRI